MKKTMIAILFLAAAMILACSVSLAEAFDSSAAGEAITPEAGWVLDSINGASWQCDRASMEICMDDMDDYKVLILWGGSAWEMTEWTYSCNYDPETQALRAVHAVCDNVAYDSDGNETRENVFDKDVETVFSLDAEGKVVIQNAGSESLEGLAFERLPLFGDD